MDSNNNNIKEVLTLEEAAEYMGLKKSYLYRLTHEKRIRHYKPNNKKIYFKVEDWRFRSKGPQKTDDYFGVKPPKKDPIIDKKGRELGSRASIFRSIATQLS